MNNLEEFSNGNIKLPVRMNQNGDIEFDAEKAAIGLGIVDTSKGTVKVRWSRLNNYLGSATFGAQVSKGDFITEPQFYKLAIKANNQTAEKFQDWVTSEVLPSIRKNGAYMTDQKAYDITHNPSSLADLLLQAGQQLKEKDAQILEMTPKAQFADQIAKSNDTILVRDLAKLLYKNGIAIGQKELFRWLVEKDYLIRRNGSYTPTQKSVELGVIETRETVVSHSYTSPEIKFTPLVTTKGQQYFINKFLQVNQKVEA